MEAEAECLAHGRVACTRAQLELGAGCAFHNSSRTGAFLWSRSPCGATDTSPVGLARHSLGFQPLRRAGTCATSSLDLAPKKHNVSFAACLSWCNATSNCKTAAYNFRFRVCKLQRLCLERYHLKVGQCEHWWMMRRIEDKVLQELFPQILGSNHTEFCYFTRGPTSLDGTTVRRRRRQAVAWRHAEQVRASLAQAFPNSSATVCNTLPLVSAGSDGLVVNVTYNRRWRYFTALECGSSSSPRVCLSFKTEGNKAVLGIIVSEDGRSFSTKSEVVRLPEPWRANMFTHNLALLRADGDSYVMMGGMQGFSKNRSCVRRHARRKRLPAGECLTMDSMPAAVSDEHGEREAMQSDATGIKLSRGTGLPWSRTKWSMPRTVITGSHPSGCVDRRAAHTGFPRLHACEFDGRLSLVAFRDRHLLYARSNLRFGAVAGGRSVQVTTSYHLEGGWSPWQPVRLAGVDPNNVDIYFFAVQTSPIDPSLLLAVFPLTEPPLACIALAVSRDGVNFSKPISLRTSVLGVRTHDKDGRSPTRLEWRGEDHPAAGLVWDPTMRQRRLLLYIHHAVKGTTMRRDAISHVRAYEISAGELERVTARCLESLRVRS